MTIYDIIFYLLALLTVFSSGFAVFSYKKTNIILSLSFTFAGLAGLFAILNAEFIAIIELIIFAGGIPLLFFLVMSYTNFDSEQEKGGIIFINIFLVSLVTAIICAAMISTKWKENSQAGGDFSIGALGGLLMSKYLLPLEVTSVLFLTVIIGVSYIFRKEKR